MENPTRPKRQDLEQLVRKHRVVYQVFPASEMVEDERVHVGYDVDILGAHEPHSRGLLPGCHRCRAVWDDLYRIGEAVHPPDDGRVTEHGVAMFDHVLHTRPASDTVGRDEVRLTLTLRHKGNYFASIDECEDRCLREVIAALRNLGAQESVWREPAPAPLTSPLLNPIEHGY